MNGTVFFIFVLPHLLGAFLRALLLKWKKGHLLSCVFALIAVIVWVWTKSLFDHGTDGTIMLWAVVATELTVGSLIVGGLFHPRKKRRKEPDLP